MSNNKSSRSLATIGGFFKELGLQAKLILRLMADRRVNPFLKILPVASLIYLVSPLDLAFGPLDDAAVVSLALYLFVELCPPNIVAEHRRLLSAELSVGGAARPEDEVVDAEFREVSTEPGDSKETKHE
jgi:uncharacterized membrane protein YkvA (DUF1232 family)